MAVGQEVDLTIDSMFASDANKNLLLRPAWRYDRDYGPDDGRDRILSNISMSYLANSIRFITPEEYDYEQKSKSLEIDSVECFRSIFDKYPDWYREENPHRHAYDEDICERCGCNLHYLNKCFNICKKCDDWLQEDTENIYSLIIPSIAEETANIPISEMAVQEEQFFAQGGTVSTMTSTGDITVVQAMADII